MRFLIFLLALGCVFVQTAWSEDRMEFRPEQPVRKIAVLGVNLPRQMIIENRNPAGMIPGLIIQGVRSEKYSKEYVSEMNTRKMLLAPELVQEIKQQLSRNYELVFLNDKPKITEGKTLDYSHIKTDADALFVIWYGHVGYISLDNETDYLPIVTMGVRMLDARSLKTIYYKQIIVQPQPEGVRGERVALPANRRYSYATVARLLAAFEDSYQGLVEGQSSIVAYIANDLGVPPDPAAREKRPNTEPQPQPNEMVPAEAR